MSLFFRASTNGEAATAALDSPVMKKISFWPYFNLPT